MILFPTIGNKVEEKHLRNSLDTLISQITTDNEFIVNSISKAFNSPSVFNNKVSPAFQKYYATLEPLPADVSFTLKNIDYHYFVPGFVAYPANSSFPPVKRTLLLSEEEYLEVSGVFKSIQIDLISADYDMKTRNASYQSILKILRKYSDERQRYLQEYTPFSKFFDEIVGYTPANALLAKYKVADLIATNTTIREDMKLLVLHLSKRFELFYTIRDNKEQTFTSNGLKYYWVPEDYLP